MHALYVAAAILAGLSSQAYALEEPLPCTTENLLAKKGLIEDASVRIDGCNRAIVATGQWMACDLPVEVSERMPWFRECLSERLASNVTVLDSLTDPTASDVMAVNTETHQLAELGDTFSFYIGLMAANIRLELASQSRNPR